MKRPPGLWILLSAGVLWLSLQDVYGIRATELIFGKSTTTTTSTEGTVSESPQESSSDETATEASTEGGNTTKPTLTGNPQIDYIWDPNLPFELKGYNLSDYPFYERVPDDIDFKCDGLHDGFYASVPHKCQVYHHCLFGIRYDFLCANYTAFDQKTFICHFVSEVDCVNSKKYWHRNDALYQAASTTTVKPLVIYTPPPQPPPIAVAPALASPRRPGGGRRRPLRRRRPQYDYYDYEEDYEYYDDRPLRSEPRRRKRPRPRRPVYDDDYEEYEDDRYERRGSGRRDEERHRKPYDRRGSEDRRPDRRRNKDRRKHEDEDDYEDDRKIDNNKRSGERRNHKRRPSDDYSAEEEDRKRNRPKGGSRRPPEDDYEDEDLPQNDKRSPPEPTADKSVNKLMIKPTSGSIYDRHRPAPRVNPPVPKNEASKYAYKSAASKTPDPTAEDEEYYDDYEDEVPVKNHRKSENSDTKRPSVKREEERDIRKQASRLRPSHSSRDEVIKDEEETPRRTQKPISRPRHRERPRSNHKKPPPVDDYYDEYEDDTKDTSKQENKSAEKSKERSSTTTSTTTTTTTKPTTTTTATTTTTTPKPATTTLKELRPETIVRIVKRPFLPSRGGNPYSSRGLQPVGTKAVDKKPESKENLESDKESVEAKQTFKPSPVIIKMPSRQKYAQSQSDSQEEFKPVSNRPQVPPKLSFKPNKEYSGPRTTQKPKLPDPDPLDIDEDEYDVTLNDALNPTLPNLPVRGYPSGFSSQNEYNSFQRPRYVLESQASSDYHHQTKPARQRYDTVPYNPQDHFVNSDVDYKGQYSTINRENYRPRITQAFYSSF